MIVRKMVRRNGFLLAARFVPLSLRRCPFELQTGAK